MPDDPRTPRDDEVVLPAHVAELLAHPGTWAAPPAVTARELIALAGEPATSTPAASVSPLVPAAASVPPAAPVSDDRGPGVVIPLRRRRWMRPVLAAAAALILVAVVTTGVLTTRERPGATIELAGATGAPAAHGSIRVIERDAGWRLVLDVQGLAPAGPGTYYQGWAIKGSEYVPLGTFHMHKAGQVELWSGVPLRQFRRIEVTSQRVGGGQDPGTVVLAGGM